MATAKVTSVHVKQAVPFFGGNRHWVVRLPIPMGTVLSSRVPPIRREKAS